LLPVPWMRATRLPRPGAERAEGRRLVGGDGVHRDELGEEAAGLPDDALLGLAGRWRSGEGYGGEEQQGGSERPMHGGPSGPGTGKAEPLGQGVGA
jgi:hypothetical protein